MHVTLYTINGSFHLIDDSEITHNMIKPKDTKQYLLEAHRTFYFLIYLLLINNRLSILAL
jgi:hypothetical protein